MFAILDIALLLGEWLRRTALTYPEKVHGIYPFGNWILPLAGVELLALLPRIYCMRKCYHSGEALGTYLPNLVGTISCHTSAGFCWLVATAAVWLMWSFIFNVLYKSRKLMTQFKYHAGAPFCQYTRRQTGRKTVW